jgi:hypothetical protein
LPFSKVSRGEKNRKSKIEFGFRILLRTSEKNERKKTAFLLKIAFFLRRTTRDLELILSESELTNVPFELTPKKKPIG